jgi:O-antigen/teichoic acid export membrane protein
LIDKVTSVLKSKLLSGFAIYLGASVINKAIPFFLLPVLTRYLTTQEYGILSIYQVMINFGLPVVGMALHVNISRSFFNVSKKELSKLVSNLLVVLLFSSTFFLVGISIYLLLGGEQFSIPDKWIYLLPAIAFMNMVNTFNLTILRNRKKAVEFGIFEISKTALDLTLTVLLIVYYAYGWEGRASGILVGVLVIGLVSFYRIWKTGYLKFDIDLLQIKSILKVCLPLIPHSLGLAIITLSDRLFIDKMVSTSAVGIYDVGYQFGMITSLVVTAFSLTWSPWVYEKLAKERLSEKLKIVKATYGVAGAYILLAIVVYIVSLVLLPIMAAEEYHGGIEYVVWVALGYSFQGMYTLVFPYGVHVGKTSYLGVTTMIATLLNLIANYYLIQINGALGAAQATLISYLFMFGMVWWYSNRIYPMPWFNAFFSKNEKQ